MEVEFDPQKNVENIRKHGVSLQRAEDFDMDSALVDVNDSQDYGEVRYNAIGWLDANLHYLTFTFTSGLCRAIGLRRATKPEQRSYAQET